METKDFLDLRTDEKELADTLRAIADTLDVAGLSWSHVGDLSRAVDTARDIERRHDAAA